MIIVIASPEFGRAFMSGQLRTSKDVRRAQMLSDRTIVQAMRGRTGYFDMKKLEGQIPEDFQISLGISYFTKNDRGHWKR